MQIVPQVSHLDGVITVNLSARFVADSLVDVDDQQRIQAYGDPLVNLAGTFVDPEDPTFSFSTAATEQWVTLVREMQVYPARFMTAIPKPRNGEKSNFVNTSLDVITTNPTRAAAIWASTIQDRCLMAMTALRQKSPAKLITLPTRVI